MRRFVCASRRRTEETYSIYRGDSTPRYSDSLPPEPHNRCRRLPGFKICSYFLSMYIKIVDKLCKRKRQCYHHQSSMVEAGKLINSYLTSIIKLNSLTGNDSLHYKTNHCIASTSVSSELPCSPGSPSPFPSSCFPAHRRLKEG